MGKMDVGFEPDYPVAFANERIICGENLVRVCGVREPVIHKIVDFQKTKIMSSFYGCNKFGDFFLPYQLKKYLVQVI